MTENAISIREGSTATAIEWAGSTQLTPEASNHFREGLEQLALGEPEQALAAFTQVLQRAPNYPDAHVGAGVAYALCSNVYPAIDHLELATELDPTSFHAHFKLSQLYFKLRVPEKGYAEAKLALRCAPEVPERQLLAQLLREERAREHDSIARPWFNRPFGTSAALAGAIAAAAAVVAVVTHLH